MARPRRMGAFNALDELLPGPGSERSGADWETAWASPPPPRRPAPRRPAAHNALDELLPGPATVHQGPWPANQAPAAGPGQRSRSALGPYNPLDELLPGPAPAPDRGAPKVRASFQVPADLLEQVRDAAAHLAGSPAPLTLAGLVEQALRAEVDRLALHHNGGRPFPRRPKRPGRGRASATRGGQGH